MPSSRLPAIVPLLILLAAPLAGAAGEHGEPAARPNGKADRADKVDRTAKAAPSAIKGEPATAGAEAIDPMDRLRERLAEKLGATKAPGNGNLLRVANRPAAEPERAAPVHKTVKAKAPPHDLHWDYTGEAGPQAWGGLKPEFALCGSGKRQSPIDIRDGIAVDLDPIQFDYRPGAFRVIDNGHTVQVNVAPGNTIVAGGRRWELVQFHFHRPSEERIDGRQFDMVVHLVHKDADGRLAVVAVLLEQGSALPLVQTVWNNLPLEKGEEQPARATLDLNQLLPADRRYYTYMGSLTTPPCSEGVLWMVMRQPVTVSPQQIDIFARLYPMNARPVQQAAGRLIKQSN